MAIRSLGPNSSNTNVTTHDTKAMVSAFAIWERFKAWLATNVTKIIIFKPFSNPKSETNNEVSGKIIINAVMITAQTFIFQIGIIIKIIDALRPKRPATPVAVRMKIFPVQRMYVLILEKFSVLLIQIVMMVILARQSGVSVFRSPVIGRP